MPVEKVTPQAGQESAWDYPRPPRLEPMPHPITIVFNGETIVTTSRAWRVLETSHPPVYYIPQTDIRMEFLRPAPGSSYCEWKGGAKYFSVAVNGKIAEEAAWYYDNPTPEFQPIKNYVAFYAGKMDVCTVKGETVRPQPGGFYGGWITSDVVGPFKGESGTFGW